MTTRALNPDQFFGDPTTIPPEFGSTPIPEGMVRFHHYTQAPENLPSIKEHGLQERYAQESFARGGSESPETFASTGTPSDDYKHGNYFVEGYADPKRGGQLNIGENWRDDPPAEHAAYLDRAKSTITFRGDIPAHQIIGAHMPWHEHARYIQRERGGREAQPGEDPYATGSMRSAVQRGEYDYMEKDPSFAKTYGPAIRATKITNAATIMLGGKL